MKARHCLPAAFAVAAALVFSGCTKKAPAPAASDVSKSAAHDHDSDHGHDHAHDHDHGEKSASDKADHDENHAKDEGHGHDRSTPDEHDHAEHDHDEHGHGESAGNATARFEADRGLQLAPETVAALGVQTATAAPRAIAAQFEVTAAVFDPGPPARASALVPIATADALENAQPRDAALLAVRRDMTSALGQAELILAAPRGAQVGQAVVLALGSAPREFLCVPRSAVLRTATGTFVYVRAGEFWRRTSIETGADDGHFVAIANGLAVGEAVATTAVEHLWLTELRLTKGGGHSH
jgi:hypothetical protein